MAASANPPGNDQEGSGNEIGQASNGALVPENSAAGRTQAALKHNPGVAVEWTADEQSLLEDLLNKYSSDTNIVRYAKIAMQLEHKTVRDVALRSRWMTKKENGKRRKEDHNSARKTKDKKEKTDPLAKPSHVATRPTSIPYSMPAVSMDNDDGISYKAIGGVTGQLLEQTAQALEQISANFGVLKILENIDLFCKARNNILKVMNDLSDIPEIMRQMPPLPVNLNEDIAISVLSWPTMQKRS